MGQIYSSDDLKANVDVEARYLGTSYILSNKADFEPRKNI